MKTQTTKGLKQTACALLLALGMVSLAACGETTPTSDTQQEENPTSSVTEEQQGGEAGASSGVTPEVDNFDFSQIGSGDSEPVVVPTMAGNVVYQFHLSKEVSSSLGALEQFDAIIELYDAANESGNNALIGITQGDSASYTECTWTLEDGTFKVRLDEFTVYSSMDLDGVTTIPGVRYSVGTSGSGTVDIPFVAGDGSTPLETLIVSTDEGTEGAEGGEAVTPDAGAEGGDAGSPEEGGSGDAEAPTDGN